MDMKIKHTLLVAASLLTMMTTACHPKEKAGLNDRIEWMEVSDSMSYVDPDLRVSEDSMALGTPAFDAKVHVLVPRTDSKELTSVVDSIAAQIVRRLVDIRTTDISVDEAVDRYISMLLNEYKSDLEEAKEMTNHEHEDLGSGLYLFVHQQYMQDSLTYNRHNAISLITRLEDYTGGAHGMNGISVLNYDLEENKRITLSSLFIPGSEDALTSMIEAELMKQFGVTTPEELQGEGFFNYENAKAGENFYLSDGGVTFYFYPYEIGAYFLGTTLITLPYTAVRPYMQNEYLRFTKP